MEKDITKDTTLGIPQGGIASPILFNIYMHNFDLLIEDKLNKMVSEINAHRENLTSNPVSKRYRQLDRKLVGAKKKD